MTGMSEAVMPIVAGMEFPLPFAPVAGECFVSEERSFHHVDIESHKELPQWEQFGEYPESLASVAKSLGDRLEKSADVADFEKPVAIKDVVTPRVEMAKTPEVRTPESPRIETPEYAEAQEFEKPIAIKDVVTPRIETAKAPEVKTPESSRIETPEYAEAKKIEKPVAIKDVVTPRVETAKAPAARTPESLLPGEQKSALAQESKSPVAETPKETRVSVLDFARAIESPSFQVSRKADVQEIEKSDIHAFDATALRMSENVHVQTPERVIAMRLVETVVETIAVTPALSSGGDGEIFIRLKSDILDGSSIRIEVKNGELKVVVVPASRTAEEILQKAQETFQNQLAERVTAWRVNVGVAAFDLRHNGRNRLEEES